MTVKAQTVFVVSYLDRAAEAVRKQGFSSRKLALDFAQAKARDTRYDFVTITPQQRVSWSSGPGNVSNYPRSALLRPQAPGVPDGMTPNEYAILGGTT